MKESGDVLEAHSSSISNRNWAKKSSVVHKGDIFVSGRRIKIEEGG